MTVRRLADETVQPASFAFTPDNQAWADKVIARYPAGRQQSAVIPILWRAQEQQGWVTRAAIETVAKLLGMAYIRVLEVATFYTQFLLKPVGSEAHIIVCGTTPCMLRGAGDLLDVCQHKIAHDPLQVSADGKLSWEEAECLGACVNAPMIMIGNDTYEDLSAAHFEEIVETFRAGNGASVKPGTQIPRVNAAAEGGQTTLLEPPTAERTYKAFPPPPPPAPAAAAPAPAPAATPAPAAAPASAAATPPTNAGRGSPVVEENAPAVKGPSSGAKLPEATAESERAKADVAAKANGQPNDAMRQGATGAESPAGKIDGGVAVGKDAVTAPTGGKKTPRKLFDAPAGAADDLTLIAGIGPGISQTLNLMGITTWRQVAGLTPDQVVLVETEAGFRGRATRDNWIAQAQALATGGVAEYRKVFGKDPK